MSRPKLIFFTGIAEMLMVGKRVDISKPPRYINVDQVVSLAQLQTFKTGLGQFTKHLTKC
jgi:hypothetical protein